MSADSYADVLSNVRGRLRKAPRAGELWMLCLPGRTALTRAVVEAIDNDVVDLSVWDGARFTNRDFYAVDMVRFVRREHERS